ncbi:hypothetical protein JOM56_006765 [Amanita muscaria]|uniref:Stress-associated endoplasmic reticulum protein n=1 Tax=Amanita muscaria (strain Koide BX008) TaxID=946122 RepID=A0A0C2XAH2_AMAMK|nr:hypothetical protein M378DRAFT_154934 [Amanita muscaria Koide BX008]
MPTQFEMRQRNAKFIQDVKAGKKPTRPSRLERMSKKSPINLWALGAVVFVIMGGVLFELVRALFL